MSQGPTPYSQTILLDANRRSSVEFSASNLADTNTALWTNQVSSGITLDIGDQISIQSAHIAQRGAGGDIIEFAGKVLGQKNISYTKSTVSDFTDVGVYTIERDDDSFVHRIQRNPNGFSYEHCETVTEEIQEKDNEASVVISYYKNANGENYITLPRNHGSASGQVGNTYTSPTTSEGQWAVPDGYPVGANVMVQSASHVFEDDFQIAEGKNVSDSDCKFRKVRNDNSRFTLFKQKRIVWNSGDVSNASASEYVLNSKVLTDLSVPNNAKCDPALHEYVLYKEKKVVQIPQGYNSPANVAAEVTNFLTTTDEPKFINERDSKARENSVIVNSTLNKAFPCTNYTLLGGEFNRAYFNSNRLTEGYVGAPGPPSTNSAGSGGGAENLATQYLNSYAYVGFKRPEIVEAGRHLPYNGYELISEQAQTNASSATIDTSIEWNEENLLMLKTLFDTQTLYPDLIRGGLTNGRTNYSASVNPTSASLGASFAEEARFLHLDLKKVSSGFYPVGSDMYNVSHSTNNINLPPLSNASDLSSVPLFFAYNNNSSHLTSNDTDGENYSVLAYGFAKKNTILGPTQPCISFLTEQIGGIPESYYQEQGGILEEFTKLGYDYHFNAYGNAAIILSSGFAPVQYYGYQSFAGGTLIRNVYVGSNNPAFQWNELASRFEFENLHTAEKVGNFYNAGDPDPTTVFGPPPTDQAVQDCYKLDKQLHYTTWSPSMFPYSVITTSGSKADQKSFPKINSNLEFDIFYDSQCGVTLEDMGYSQKNWDQGLWGIVGYDYNQFNAEGPDIQNRLIKYQDDTRNVVAMTTNADISSVDSQTYSTNVWSTNLYSQQPNSQINYFSSAKNFSTFTDTPTHEVAPTSVVLANSTRITSAKLPRRILRGYFLINSDILDQANFYQTANPLQTMAMVGKYSGANGFIQYDGGGAQFTCTRKKTITSIKTQILDPEGGLSQIGDNSGIIYRIDKQIQTDLEFGKNLLAGMYGKQPK